MASGEAANMGLVQKLTPLVKGGQVFSKTVPNGDEFQLVKSAYKIHTSPSLARASSTKENKDTDVMETQDQPYEGSLTHIVRQRTSSIDSQGSVEEELTLLRKKVEQQEQSLESLKLTILSVREESTCQKEVTDRVATRFRSHRSLIDRTLRQTQMALQEQQTMLCRQEMLVQKLERERREGSSVFLESAYILLGMYIIQTPLVRYTVHLLSVQLDRRGRHSRWLPRFMQILFFMHFVKLCRALNSYLGFSGGLQSVFSWLGNSVRNVMSRLTGVKQDMLAFDSTATRDWTRAKEETRQGFNLLDQHKLINASKEASPTKSLNIC